MDNPFIKILKSIFSSDSDESVVGIDVGTSSIKVVQLKKKGGRAVLETYGTLSLGLYAGTPAGTVTNLPAEKVGLALTDVMRESGVTTTNGAISITSSASLIFVIELPALVTESQFATVIPTEARKYIPVPISEVTLDWWVLPKQEASFEAPDTPSLQKNEVLVVAIHNDTLSKYRSIATTANVSSSFFEIEVFSTIRAVLGHELSPVMIMDFGASRTKLVIVEFGVVRSFHVITRGSADITNALSKSLSIEYQKAEEMKRTTGLSDKIEDKTVSDIITLSTDYIFSETNSAILNYERKYNKTISKIILTGGGSLLPGFLAKAKGSFTTEVVAGDPFSKVEAPAFLEDVLKTTGPEFTVALGLALRKLQ